MDIKRNEWSISFGDALDGPFHIGMIDKIEDPDWRQFGYQWTFFLDGHTNVGYGFSPTKELAFDDLEGYANRFIERMEGQK